MSKNVLVVYYSQSGQLKSIVDNLMSPFQEKEIAIEWLRVQPKNDFPFPWTAKSFFNAMPESVLGIAAEISTPQFKHERYDLIVFAYQPWFLSPSIPATSILLHPVFKKRVANTPVVTIIGSRNMWINAQEKIKSLLKQSNAHHVANIVLSDRHNNFISAVTIQYWMFTGKRDKFLGIFPRPGVSDADIKGTKHFGNEILQALELNDWQGLQQRLVSIKAVEIQTTLMFIENRAPAIFRLWANAIIKKKIVLCGFKSSNII